MSAPGPDTDSGRALSALAAHAAECGARVALIGAQARRAHGSGEVSAAIDVAADTPPTHETAEPLHLGGSALRLHGVRVHWLVRGDEFAPLYDAALVGAEELPGWPIPVARIEHVAAMMLATRRSADHERLIAALAGGLIDKDAARRAVLEHLGPYAVGDFETLLQEAEWHAMRQRYEGEGGVH